MPAAKTRALIIEPSASYRGLLKGIFTARDCWCMAVENGQEALVAAQRYHYGVITMSRYLTDIAYADLVRQIRAIDGYRAVPVFLITSEEKPQTVNDALAHGITDVFAKTDIASLEASLERILARIRLTVTGRVVYVEDSPSLSTYITGVLEVLGLEVLAFREAEPALQALRDEDLDMVITDILLEGPYSGLRLMREIRKLDDEVKRTVPILAVTGLDDPMRRTELLNLGADDYVVKPIIRDEFVSRVSNIITRQQLVMQLRKRESGLRRLALFDGLSGLYNRNGLQQMGSGMLAEARAQGKPLSLAIIDLDKFKYINDTFGHDVGDTVITAAGNAINQVLTVDAIGARWGGDEFVVVTPGTMGATVFMADRVRETFLKQSPQSETNCSIGVAAFEPGADENLDDLFKKADQALYQAKQDGRGCTRVFSAD